MSSDTECQNEALDQVKAKQSRKIYSIVLLIFCLSPFLLIPFIFYGDDFAPSPLSNFWGNWYGATAGGLASLGCLAVLIFAKKMPGKSNGKPMGRLTVLFFIPFSFLVLASMGAGLSQVVVGKFLHGFSNEKCHFSRTLKTKAHRERRGMHYYIDLKGSEDAFLSWRISEQKYNHLPYEFDATILASQSKFGVDIDDFIVETAPPGFDLKKLSNIGVRADDCVAEGKKSCAAHAGYETVCTAKWVLEPMGKRGSNIVFYWY